MVHLYYINSYNSKLLWSLNQPQLLRILVHPSHVAEQIVDVSKIPKTKQLTILQNLTIILQMHNIM